MSGSVSDQGRTDDIRQQAATWLVRMQAGGAVSKDPAFAAWLAQSDGHKAAWASVNGTWSGIEAAAGDPAIARMRRAAKARSPMSFPKVPSFKSRWAPAVGGAVAATLALTVAVLAPPDMQRGPARALVSLPSGAPALVLTTAMGKSSTTRLADGSMVTLDTNSVVNVARWGSERRLTLVRGRAFFDVAKDPHHPFIVAIGDKTVTALGTAFDIRKDDDQVAVDLVRGKVLVMQHTMVAPASMHMVAGQRLVATASKPWTLVSADMTKALAWTHGETVFDNTPLSAAIAEMNRYSARKISIQTRSLNDVAVNGVFRSGDVDQFAAALQAYGIAKINRGDDGAILLFDGG